MNTPAQLISMRQRTAILTADDWQNLSNIGKVENKTPDGESGVRVDAIRM
jgi:hypothetical protein